MLLDMDDITQNNGHANQLEHPFMLDEDIAIRMAKYPSMLEHDIAAFISKYPIDAFKPVLVITLNGLIVGGWVSGVADT